MLWIQTIFFVALSLAFEVASSVHPPPHEIFKSLQGLGPKHEFHYANEDKFVNYSYEAEKSDNVIHLEDITGIKSLRCQKTSLTLAFTDRVAASEAMERHSWKVGRVITGRNRGCAKPVMEKIVSFEIRGEVMEISTVPALLNEVFVNANIKLKTNMNPKEINPESLRPASFENPNLAQKDIVKRGLISSFFSVFSSFAHAIANVVEGVIDVVEASWDIIVEGEFVGNYNHTWQGPSWNYNWDEEKSQRNLEAQDETYNPQAPWLTCDNCFFYSDLVFEFELVVRQHHLIVLKIINQLDVELNVEYALNVTLRKQGSTDFPLAAPKLRYNILAYSIPVYLSLSVPISFGVEWDMQLTTQIKGRSNYVYQAIFGYQYVIDDHNSGYIFETSNEHHGNITNAELNASAKAEVYLQATFVAQLTGIGELFIGARAGIEIGIEANSNLCQNDYSFNSGWKFLVSRGGELNILGVFQKRFKTKTLYRKRGNIQSGCLIGDVFTPSTVVIGASWSGSAYRDDDDEDCVGAPVFLDWTLDLVARDGDVYYFALSESDTYQESMGCLTGHIYVAGPPSKNWRLRYYPIPDEYFECTEDKAQLIPLDYLTLNCSSDYSTCVPEWRCDREWDKITFTSPFIDCIPTDISCPLRRDLAYFRQHNSEYQKRKVDFRTK